MKKLLYTFLCCTLLLAGCSKDLAEHTPTGTPENNAALFLAPQHFYGTAYSELVTKGVAQADKLWPAGSTITVKFLNDDYNMATQVEEWAKEWEQYANITFDFVDPSQEAQVRIGFDWNDNRWITWSYIGTDCLTNTDQGDATISYAFWDSAYEYEQKGDVLRTFGQVLGLELEHRHLDFDPGWVSEAQVRKFWTNDIEDIPWSDLQKYVYTPLEQAGTLQSENYDPASIMIWPFRYQYAANTQTEFNYLLSETDKDFIARLYPDQQETEVIARIVPEEYWTSFSMTVKSDVMIDWGDGSQETLRASEYPQSLYHTYPDNRNYDIVIYGMEDALVTFYGGYGNGGILAADLNGSPYLQSLTLNNCHWTNPVALPWLETFIYSYNDADQIDLNLFPRLKELFITYPSHVTEVSFAGLPELEHLNVQKTSSGTQIPFRIDVSHNSKLSYLYCNWGILETPDLSQNPLLETLGLPSSNLTSIDLSQNTLLKNLFLENNLFTAIDLSYNTRLEEVNLSDNRLESLDVSQCTSLRELQFSNNKLSELDVTNNSLLEKLYCLGNPALNRLNISQNLLLQDFRFDATLTAGIIFGNNTELQLIRFNNLSNYDPIDFQYLAQQLPDRNERTIGILYYKTAPLTETTALCEAKNWVLYRY